MKNRPVHICGPKGGCGKTAAALNVAGGLSARGLSVLLVDLDPNGPIGGATRWAQLAHAAGRETTFLVSPAVPRNATFDVIVYDHPPQQTTKLPEGQFIVPTTLDPGTYFSTREVVQLLRHRHVTPIVVAMRARLDRSEPRRLVAALGDDVPVIRDRAVIPACFGRGATVYDDGVGLNHTRLARAEFDQIISQLLTKD
jgi:cellulose biosynthesis protein BcsQ